MAIYTSDKGADLSSENQLLGNSAADLALFSPEARFGDIRKQCRPSSDAAERGV